MKELEGLVRGLNIAGLTWGASKLLPVAYGVKKLQIMATVLDDDFSGDDMEEQILGWKTTSSPWISRLGTSFKRFSSDFSL
eukprot:TRINITY_DN128_c0_g1_i4.p3 TRINITY_DN128_c0_g1~~TRINITY_DN128_c0_g1_i4.p3  ORF type:complete len:81 (+),score=24.85 TRINITY_DN128_c0_g1_i4:446-688(+)